MTRLFTIIALLVLSVGSVHAQQAAYQITPPPGWQRVPAENGVEVFASATDPGSAAVAMFPVLPLAGTVEQQLTLVRTLVEPNRFADVQAQPSQAGRLGGAETVVQTVTFASADGGRGYLTYYARGEKGAFGMLMFTAGDSAVFERNRPAADAMFKTFSLTGQTAQTQGQTPPPPAAQAQPPATQTPPPAAAQMPQAAASQPAEGKLAANISAVGRPVTNATLADLVGIWVSDTAYRNDSVRFGSYTDNWGTSYNTTTLSFSSPMGAGGKYLKVRPNGTYEFWYDLTFLSCTTQRNHSGAITVQNGLVTLHPTRKHERVEPAKRGTCAASDRDVAPQPETFQMELNAYNSVFGLPTYRLRLVNLANSSDYHVLDRLEARPSPAAPAAITRNFIAGTAVPARDLLGTWTAPEDTPAGFTIDSPKDGKYHAVLKLLAGGRYELAVHRPDVLFAPVCAKNLTLIEQGTVQLGGQIHSQDNKQEFGGLVLWPTLSRLTSEVVRCGPDDNKASYNLPVGIPRYFRWNLRMQNAVTDMPRVGDSLDIRCPDIDEQQAPWQFLVCPQSAAQHYNGYLRR